MAWLNILAYLPIRKVHRRMHGKNVLGEIYSNRDNGHAFPLLGLAVTAF